MSLRRRAFLATFLALSAAGPVRAMPQLGALAPDVPAVDADGRRRTLKDFLGKVVVLEWTSSECPYSRKHYDSGTMQRLQQAAVADGTIWLTVSSSAPGREGYFTPKTARAWRARVGNHATAILLDGDGKLGRAYAARATPHMFIIDRGWPIWAVSMIVPSPTRRA